MNIWGIKDCSTRYRNISLINQNRKVKTLVIDLEHQIGSILNFQAQKYLLCYIEKYEALQCCQ